MVALAWVVGILGFLLLLFAFPRQTGAVIGVLVLVAVGLWLYFSNQSAQSAREKSLVTASAYARSAPCENADYPVFVYFENKSRRTVEYVSFTLKGRRPQHSSSVFDDYRYSDRILAPGETYGACWAPSRFTSEQKLQDVTTLQWSAEILSVRFKG
jgi:hypothetical protein